MRFFYFLPIILLFISCKEKEISIETISSKEITSVDIYSVRIANNQRYFDLKLQINGNKIDYIFDDLRDEFNTQIAKSLDLADRKGSVELDSKNLNTFLENVKTHSTSSRDDQMFETVVNITTNKGSILSKTRDIEMIKKLIKQVQYDVLNGEITILVL